MTNPYERQSNEKLDILMKGLKFLPKEAFENIKNFELDWKVVFGGEVLPVIKVEYKNSHRGKSS